MGMLTHLNDTEKRNAITEMSTERRQTLIRGCYQGTPCNGFGLDEAMAATGSDFAVRGEPMFMADGTPVPGFQAAVNGSTGQPMSVVSDTFGFVDHSQAIEPLREVLDRGDAILQAVSLREGGAKFDATALLGFAAVNRSGMERPDALAYFLRCGNAHDGSSNVWIAASAWRLACTNGMGFTEHVSRERRRHTSRVQDRMPDFGRAVTSLVLAAEAETSVFQELADTPMSPGDFVEFSAELLEAERGKADTDRKVARRESDLTELLTLFEHGQGNFGRDRYDALNALTEWLTPRRESYRTADRYVSAFYSNETGSRAATRRRAIRMLTR